MTDTSVFTTGTNGVDMLGDQLPFDFPGRSSFTRADFMVSPANEAAMAWIERWPDWPGTALAISGPPGAGKSHLAEIWRQRAEARTIAPDALKRADLSSLLNGSRAVLIDDADGAPERPLLHLYNGLAERAGRLLIVARSPPSRWNIRLADLRSRLAASPHVAIAPPDDALLGAVLVKLFADRQLAVSREVVDYLVSRLERSFAAANDAVAAIDRAALAQRRRINLPLVRAALGFDEKSAA
jgi:chromosomal replication initiation ATPase DnaA